MHRVLICLILFVIVNSIPVDNYSQETIDITIEVNNKTCTVKNDELFIDGESRGNLTVTEKEELKKFTRELQERGFFPNGTFPTKTLLGNMSEEIYRETTNIRKVLGLSGDQQTNETMTKDESSMDELQKQILGGFINLFEGLTRAISAVAENFGKAVGDMSGVNKAVIETFHIEVPSNFTEVEVAFPKPPAFCFS
ncbi:hypothetical protein AB6A40_003234 [Gnathostoma spinigerum]|uniref:Secreted protein n=1 Tax=Gnathostoma spinigerum TaxID=75299 RepID=A0ABD6EA49_9BILA